MKGIVRLLCFLVMPALMISFFYPLKPYAQEVQQFSAERLAVSLVIDTSGSMRESDPDNLRLQAANIFLDLMSQDDYVGLITFNTEVTEVIPLQQVSDTSNREALKNEIKNQITATGDTDYKEALDAAMEQLNQVQDENVKKVILFLTDGEPEPEPDRKDDIVFMQSYMESLSNSVQVIASNECPIYAIGFSDGIQTDVLSNMADETDGSFKILPDSSSIAASFFEILGELKNRKMFISETMPLNGKYELPVSMDEYTSQATIVMQGDQTGQYTITVHSDSGEDVQQHMNVQQGSGYTIVTLHHVAGELDGTWTVSVQGVGDAEIYGNRDFNIQSQLITPSPEAKYQKGQQVAIKLFVTGESKTGISASALVTDSYGNSEVVPLENTDNFYQGIFDATNIYGEYHIEVGVMLNGEILMTKNETFSVNVVPKLNTSVYLKKEGYRIGETIPVQAWMSIADTRLKEGSDLSISTLKLQITHSNNTISEIEMTKENGEENNGIWNGEINLQEETIANLKLIAEGVYKEEDFVIEQEIGDYTVKPAGQMNIEVPETEIYGLRNEVFSIPIIIQNDSEFNEMLRVDCDGINCDFEGNHFVMAPGERREVELYVTCDANVTYGKYPVKFIFSSNSNWTRLSTQEADVEITVLSRFGMFQRNVMHVIHIIQDYTSGVRGVAVGFICLFVLSFVVLGIFFYKKMYLGAKYIRGTLTYKNQQSGKEEILHFDQKHQMKIVISFDEQYMNADYTIAGTKYRYQLIFSAGLKATHFRMIAGWRTFLTKKIPVKYKIEVTAPGIIIKNQEIVTSKVLQEDDVFESGGYEFHYQIAKNKWDEKKTQGYNLLEGKYEES